MVSPNDIGRMKAVSPNKRLKFVHIYDWFNENNEKKKEDDDQAEETKGSDANKDEPFKSQMFDFKALKDPESIHKEDSIWSPR